MGTGLLIRDAGLFDPLIQERNLPRGGPTAIASLQNVIERAASELRNQGLAGEPISVSRAAMISRMTSALSSAFLPPQAWTSSVYSAAIRSTCLRSASSVRSTLYWR